MLLAEHKYLAQLIALAATALLLLSCHPERRAEPICMPGDHRDFRGRCTTQTPVHLLPFRAGYETLITQGFHDPDSHENNESYAIDFRCSEGDPIVATSDGVVWEARKDSMTGCTDPTCGGQANYVVLDLGDGTYAEYYHLAPYGALVEAGDQVCAGQVIGICGVTGYTTGEHLHWQLSDLSNQSIPVRFSEIQRQNGIGYPTFDATYVSANKHTSRCRDTSYSTLPEGAFVHLGVVLEEPLPLVWKKGASTRTIRGRYFGSSPKVAVYRSSRDALERRWFRECVKPDAEGHFEITIDWEAKAYLPGFYLFMIMGADDNCEEGGEWSWSYRMRLDGDEPARRTVPPSLEPDRGALRMPE